jgi:hypothetical protein
MSEAREPDRPLPEQLRPLFWDYNFDSLHWPEHRDFVITRILQEGDHRATAWLRDQLGLSGLAEWIRHRRGRGLDPRRLQFWQVVLDLPAEEVDVWMKDALAIPGKVQ